MLHTSKMSIQTVSSPGKQSVSTGHGRKSQYDTSRIGCPVLTCSFPDRRLLMSTRQTHLSSTRRTLSPSL